MRDATKQMDDSAKLCLAAHNGNLDDVDRHIRDGGDVNYMHRGAVTPLIAASQRNHVSIVQRLIERGADACLANDDGKTPLYQARGTAYPPSIVSLGV